MRPDDNDVEEVDPDDLAPDADDEGDEVDPELKDLATTRKKDVEEDEVDGPDKPRTAENRKDTQS
jgi:hypothetical protein